MSYCTFSSMIGLTRNEIRVHMCMTSCSKFGHVCLPPHRSTFFDSVTLSQFCICAIVKIENSLSMRETGFESGRKEPEPWDSSAGEHMFRQ